jgi:hypothetical protein
MSKNVEIIGLRDLKPDPQNARKHTPRNVAAGSEIMGDNIGFGLHRRSHDFALT